MTEPVETKDCFVPAQQLDAERFFANMITTLSATLENVVGIEDACALIGRVGNDVGKDIGDKYRDAAGVLPSDNRDIADVLVDLKDHIGGAFAVESVSEDQIILTASRCPFGKAVEGHPSLCMMTTNVFGRIAADSTGYAKVRIDEALALGHGRCRVTVVLQREADSGEGHEFFS